MKHIVAFVALLLIAAAQLSLTAGELPLGSPAFFMAVPSGSISRPG